MANEVIQYIAGYVDRAWELSNKPAKWSVAYYAVQCSTGILVSTVLLTLRFSAIIEFKETKAMNKPVKVIGGLFGAVVVIGVIGAIAGGGEDDASNAAAASSATTTVEQATTTQVVATEAEAPATVDSTQAAPSPAPFTREVTPGQANALAKGKQYLKMQAFSHSGLVEQLEYEGFSTADATYGADHVGADWTEQAVRKGRQYLQMQPFSHSGLVEQLTYEGFTPAQAEAGETGAGV